MPYVSDAQRRFFHSPGAKKAGITSSEVSEFDSASKGMKLPKRAKKKKTQVLGGGFLGEEGLTQRGPTSSYHARAQRFIQQSHAQGMQIQAEGPQIIAYPKGQTPNPKLNGIGAMKMKKKAKLVVNNNMKAFGQMNPKTNKVEINVKKHKGDKTELANSIHHELLHVKHPNMSEKDVANKADTETLQMTPAQKSALVAKIRGKKLHYKQGAMKRKFKLGRMEAKPGTFIDQMNIKKKEFKSNNRSLSQKQVAIRGLI